MAHRSADVETIVTLRIPRELRSPNAWMWTHWRIKQRERETWEREVFAQAAIHYGTGRAMRLQVAGSLGSGDPSRHRVTVTRVVPSRRNFIRDDDNLRFSVKPLNDALKRCGLIYSDARTWLEQSMPTQTVSPHGRYETIVEIERLTDD
jgi:hypothetical protein